MLFIYGTLQDADVLGAVLGRMVDRAGLRRAQAPGYRAVPYPGRVQSWLKGHKGCCSPGIAMS